MADCAETLRELDRFLDNELASESVQEMAEHLEGCSDCQQAFEFHAELRHIVRQANAEDSLPPSLMTKIEQCFGIDDDADES
jgi:mycothiol system anti-sigma-R factor